MDLQVLISKKGTKVVTATNLHAVLELPSHHYSANVKRWLREVYEFRDGIRRPASHKDYALRRIEDAPAVTDYYLSVELAKQVALRSKSKQKQKYAKQLLAIEEDSTHGNALSQEQIKQVLELTRAMGLVSCQETSEHRHQSVYAQRNGGSCRNWWKYRATILGYNADDLKERARKMGKPVKGKNQRELLMMTDKYEMIRAGVIDLFMSMGKSQWYARRMGDLAKLFAAEFEVDIFDDRDGGNVFAPQVNGEMVRKVKNADESVLIAA